MSSREQSSSRPNFLIILADDLGWSDVGCFGSEISTPNVDALASSPSGLRFTDFHTAALCSPTRSMLLTGTDHHIAGLGQLAEFIRRSPSHNGQPGHEGYLNDRVVTFPQLMKDAGYWTVMSGKWHLGLKKEQSPWAKGFCKSFALLPGCANHYNYEPPMAENDEVPGFFATNTAAIHREDADVVKKLPDDFYSSNFYADKLIEYLKGHQKEKPEQPFFAFLPFSAVHWPLQAPKENCDHYLGRYDKGPFALRSERIQKQKELGLIPKDIIPHPVIAPEVPKWEDMSEGAKAKSCRTMEVYAGMVENMDQNIGKVLEYLKESGQFDNTYIIFMSDNGAEGAAIEASPVMQGKTLEHMQKYYDNSLDNIGRKTSYCWYGPLWSQAATAPSRLYKWYSTEGGVRVPFLIHKPGIAQRGRDGITDAFCTVMDLAPTILDLAGIPPPADGLYNDRSIEPIRGRSWVPFLDNSSSSAAIHSIEHPVGWELMGCGALRQGFWKINWVPPPMGPGKWQLYDLSKDRSELNDLAEKNPEKLKELLGLWETYRKEVGVVGLKDELQDYTSLEIDENNDDWKWLRFMRNE
ncbi:MAG: hypothetical protein M1834_008457 [Cirrosporium novae-zelandiae]|nr:MAG: hypothetical protein M1834_008457 [Cirrosporium novae-zelandiae]